MVSGAGLDWLRAGGGIANSLEHFETANVESRRRCDFGSLECVRWDMAVCRDELGNLRHQHLLVRENVSEWGALTRLIGQLRQRAFSFRKTPGWSSK